LGTPGCPLQNNPTFTLDPIRERQHGCPVLAQNPGGAVDGLPGTKVVGGQCQRAVVLPTASVASGYSIVRKVVIQTPPETAITAVSSLLACSYSTSPEP
jgi:hypothetical protein